MSYLFIYELPFMVLGLTNHLIINNPYDKAENKKNKKIKKGKQW